MRISDWSSDVCSSDLLGRQVGEPHILERLAPLGAGARRDRGLGELDIALSIAAPDEAERVAAVALDHGRLRLLFEFGADSEIEVDAATERQEADIVGQIGRASCRERVCQYV